MTKRRELEIALLAALAAALPGCAGKSLFPSWGGKSAAKSQSLDNLSVNSKPSFLEKTGTSLSKALTIEPKVTPAADPTSLNSRPSELGPEIFVSAARINETRGDFAEAEKQYRKAIETAPEHTPAYISLARLYDRQQQFSEAEATYRKAAELQPTNALIWNDLGLCYARQKRLDDAAKTLEQAVKLAPENAMYRNNIATVLVEKGRTDEAWSHLSASSRPAVAHYNLGCLLLERDQTERAAHHLELALQADPTLVEAEDALAQIHTPPGARPDTRESYAGSTEAPRYSLSDESARSEVAHVRPVSTNQEQFIAERGSVELTNPYATANHRSSTFRMPPTEGQAPEAANTPTRLPHVVVPEDARPAESLDLNHPQPREFSYPGARTSHSDEGIQQPKNVIRLLGSEPLTAPIPK